MRRELSIYAVSLFMFAVLLSAYLSTKFSVGDMETALLGIIMGFFAVVGFTIKLSTGHRLSQRFIHRDALDVGLMAAVGIAVLQAVLQMLGALASVASGIVVVVMAVGEEYFFTGLLDLIAKESQTCRHDPYANGAVAMVFAVFHKAAYGLSWAILLVLSLGRLILNWAYLKAGLDASLTAHLLVNLASCLAFVR